MKKSQDEDRQERSSQSLRTVRSTGFLPATPTYVPYLVVFAFIPALASGQTFADVWRDAQAEITQLGVDGDPLSVELDTFEVLTFEELQLEKYASQLKTCNRRSLRGCFAVVRDSESVRGILVYHPIRISSASPRYALQRLRQNSVLKHEACHAILWALGDERWPRYGVGHSIPPVR